MVPDLRSPRNLAHPFQNDAVWTLSQVNHGLTQLAPVQPLIVLDHIFQTKRTWQSRSKHLTRWYRGKLCQSMVDSWYCLDRVVPEGMSQVSRQSEVGNHKQRTLNFRLFSVTSAETFACLAGPYKNRRGKAGTTNEPDRYFVPDPNQGSENRSSRFEPRISLISFSRGSGPPLNRWCFNYSIRNRLEAWLEALHIYSSLSPSKSFLFGNFYLFSPTWHSGLLWGLLVQDLCTLNFPFFFLTIQNCTSPPMIVGHLMHHETDRCIQKFSCRHTHALYPNPRTSQSPALSLFRVPPCWQPLFIFWARWS
jgi:hypothetical protein